MKVDEQPILSGSWFPSARWIVFFVFFNVQTSQPAKLANPRTAT
jgi:hypothetical protein